MNVSVEANYKKRIGLSVDGRYIHLAITAEGAIAAGGAEISPEAAIILSKALEVAAKKADKR